ncbi:MAG: hypothetical protein LBK68_00790 [Candidatus Margulisbacteria bacterium]|jgi:hypothetical protein|nr:hypothetical protein [Candidatus Margulisiibacteriota bacterium]
MYTNLKAFEDKPGQPPVPPSGNPPPLDDKSKTVLTTAAIVITAATVNSCDLTFGTGNKVFGEPIPNKEDPEKIPEMPPYGPAPGTGAVEHPEGSGSKPQPESESTVNSWGKSNYEIKTPKELDVIFYECDKDHPAGIKIDLDKYYRLHEEAGLALPSTITLRFENITNLTSEQLKNFTLTLLDSTGAKEEKPSDAHTGYVRLKDQRSLTNSNTVFSANTMTVTLDLTKRKIESANIMMDEGEESDPTDASYISNIRSNAVDSFSFDMAARQTDKKDWAFTGVYYSKKFDLPVSATFSYGLSDFTPPNKEDAGYRIVFSFGKKQNGNYRELVYDPTGFTNGLTTNVPAGRLQESYLSLRDAEAEVLGSDNLRIKFYDYPSARVTVKDQAAENARFKFDLLHEGDGSDPTRLSYLKMKVKKYPGFSKEDFLSKVNPGLILDDGKECPAGISSGDMDYVLATDLGDSYELAIPLLLMNNINIVDQCTLGGVFFSSVAGRNEFEIADIKISAVEQGERKLALSKTDRTGFTGFGVALDNSGAQTGITLSGLKVGSQEINAPPADLDSEVQAITLTTNTGYYLNDDEEQSFISTGLINFKLKLPEETQGAFFRSEVKSQTEETGSSE